MWGRCDGRLGHAGSIDMQNESGYQGKSPVQCREFTSISAALLTPIPYAIFKIVADVAIEDAAKEEWDLVALPGGMPGKWVSMMSACRQTFWLICFSVAGASHLRDSKALSDILEKQKGAGKNYAAICAAPAVVLAEKGMVGEGATCYPAPQFREKLTNPTDDIVSVTGQVTTSKGPGTAIMFALELGEQLFGKEIRDKIEKEMLV